MDHNHKINLLDISVANLIAAGEVVDRPASVVKELLENAVDAGGHRITVEIQHGGISLIRVSDDGCGMSAEDLPVCILRHATSKIKNAGDLDGIRTLGFRGEALAAIAAVSHLYILTKRKEDETGSALESIGGVIQGIEETGGRNGTTVMVKELFSNVPARRKFLKKDASETMAVTAVVEKLALSRPDISFTYLVDGTQRFRTEGDNRLQNAIYAVLGKDYTKGMIPVHALTEGIGLNGFLCAPIAARATRSLQNFFINGRYVKCSTAAAAVERAYHSYIPSDRFPGCVLHITLHPAFVDVNVHPTKLEVKFANEQAVFNVIYTTVREILAKKLPQPALRLHDVPGNSTRAEEGRQLLSAFVPLPDRTENTSTVAEQITMLSPASKEIENTPNRHDSSPVFSAKPPVSEGSKISESNLQSEIPIPSAAPLKPDLNRGREAYMPISSKESVSPSLPPVTLPRLETAGDMPLTKSSEARQAPLSLNWIPEETESTSSDSAPPPKSKPAIPPYRIVGIVADAYIFVEQEDRVLVIDKHAAHERILFEKLKKAYLHRITGGQVLMIPLNLPLAPDEYAEVGEYTEEIQAIGFHWESDAASHTLKITQIPFGITQTVASDMMEAIAHSLAEGTGTAMLTRDLLYEKALYSASCKGACKAGIHDSEQDVRWICDQLMSSPDIRYCPHGRPVAFEITRRDLERQFGRT